MQPIKAITQELRRVLEQAERPERLDSHPWTRSLLVAQQATTDGSLIKKSPGYQLLTALACLFRETMPSLPPRRGKRLDTRWGQFGLLTALYFAPFEYSTLHPASLADAWGRIDQVIPLYVFGQSGEALPETEVARYRLIEQEAETAPTSTLSDWHVKGLERLAGLILSRETHLSQQLGQPSVVLESLAPTQATLPAPALPTIQVSAIRLRWQQALQTYRQHKRQIWIGLAIILIVLGVWKGVRVYTLAQSIWANQSQLREAASLGDLAELAANGPVLHSLRQDLHALHWEVWPFAWLGKLFGWVPVYGGDIAAASDLLQVADNTVTAIDEVYLGLQPVLQTQAAGQETARSDLVEALAAAQPNLTRALDASKEALSARSQIEADHLSPRTRRLVVELLDPYLPLLRDGLQLALAAPKLLGGAEYGPQTYLILLQNEDELRATGGFITAVGSVTLDRGDPIAVTIEESYAVDDFNQPYLPAPWQLDKYMATHIWLLRDANWSPDFLDTAALAEHDYAYTRFHAVDGVVALDQEAIRLLLGALGPVQIETESEPITADNFIEHVRSAKDPSFCGGLVPEEREGCKVFLRPMATALIERLRVESVDWPTVFKAMLTALNERHILIQLDEPQAAEALAGQGWDGAVRPGPGDYLRVVDSNLGFNKVNAAVAERLIYTVDLTDPQSPTAELTISHHNQASGPAGCQAGPDYGTGDYSDLIQRCYWNYLRVYKSAATELLTATPHAIPAEWMLLKEAVPAQVDELESINGTEGWGTLLVVPRTEQVTTQFQFALPPDVISSDANTYTYRLLIQKQAGTVSIPLTLRVVLPEGAGVLAASQLGVSDGNNWRLELGLRTDVTVSLTFH